MIRLYKIKECPRCERLADFLTIYQIDFTEEPLDAAAATEYLCSTGLPALAAPLLQVEENWFGPDQLFIDEELDVCSLQSILGMV